MSDYDVLIIGSGFGGSVAALRATEKGYRVGVLESGRRFADDELPKTSWRLRKYLWAPALGCYGVQRIHLLPDVLVMAGAGVGGGSLNYANTLYQPPKRFFEDPQWGHITDWQRELAPYYDQAKRMLGVTTNPTITRSDKVMKEVAEDMGVGETFTSTPVGVFFGDAGKTSPDPFFGGVGPTRTGCTECGSCMTGCRVGAKNTLVKNYLYLAEQAGAEVHPLTTVTAVGPAENGGYEVVTRRTGGKVRRAEKVLTADQVVFAAGTYGTQKLLLAMKETGQLPCLSDRIGSLVRTNSEAVLAATARGRDVDYTEGVAITSSFHPDDHTHIEPVRYGKGSNAIGLLQTVLSDGGGRTPRILKTLGVALRHPGAAVRSLSVRRWSERTVIALVMQTDDNSLELGSKKGWFGRRLTSRPGAGDPPPQWIPQGHEAIRLLADKIDGDPGGSIAEIVNIPMTAHFLGGCAIGDSAERGVVDAYHRVYGYEGLHVVDGSAVSANLGVNPSLTITAQAERAMGLWPNKGEQDARPAVGTPYREVAPTAPTRPVVPAAAPGALRLPLLQGGSSCGA
ncbi:GMC family oxidoreductase [Rhodococcus sp. BP-252]|uniref:GMC oxidoreductase n=1 Tax=unclassified Rhodococcus (in: high G+C Gram-positive bacteria) TaxID=192944 RepID=UPI001C9AEDFA|nr:MULTISPECIES: GMC family oxidoreductase [unclassified Rhodococcus (in: high G+C Gram-positive bacteria)]MBY6410857.1 GMC family oxidoreductase [Rhodococcus sp. BP-320]MBY6415318.1 GMC family oxidoreductase [Rhodococcus sp. BP-321]MBY6419933.1 GMC family oxidoreductase [Rhodococcus sp. BP-324]MBY6425413.1 GMC family oxidoreductase [Rhodococcus sp. BP-323]MBY6430524.1 GMC family oxidoreductase [Rhodococcus sp. BP-322]